MDQTNQCSLSITMNDVGQQIGYHYEQEIYATYHHQIHQRSYFQHIYEFAIPRSLPQNLAAKTISQYWQTKVDMQTLLLVFSGSQ